MDTVSQWCQGIHAFVAYQPDGSAPSTATTVWSAHGFTLFASKRNAPVSSVPTRHVTASGIKKFPFLVVLHLVLSVLVFVGTLASGQELFFGQNCFFSVAIENIR